MQELESPIIGAQGFVGVALVIILLTWVLYKEEWYSRRRGSYTTSYCLTFFIGLMLSFFIVAFPGLYAAFTLIDQIAYVISILSLSIYLVFLIRDIKRELKM
ncbi:MAG: hypothetical protein OEV85_04645 [Candidatus Thorarchaeota archaeon]|nr:hypothetical protein [Candidatus Thorarchaeota archaeon]